MNIRNLIQQLNSPRQVRGEFNLEALILPLIAEQFLDFLIGFADSLMVASIGESAVSGVSLISGFNNFFLYAVKSFAVGGSIVCSQYFGDQKKNEARKSVCQLITLLGTIVITASACFEIFSNELLKLLFGNADNLVFRDALTYYRVIAISYPFIALYYIATAALRSVGDSKSAMLITLLMNVINIMGNAILIYWMHLDVLGAGIATLISRICGTYIAIKRLVANNNNFGEFSLIDAKLDKKLAKKVVLVGAPNSINSFITQLGKLVTVSMVSCLGTSQISANAIGNDLMSLANIPGNAIAIGLLSVIGQCRGADNFEGIKRYTKKLMKDAYFFNAVVNSLVLIFSPYLISLWHLSSETNHYALILIRSFNLASIFLWVSAFVLPKTLDAVGDVKFTMLVSTLSMWICRVGLTYLLVFYFHMGVFGTWMGSYINWIILSICYITRYKNEKWKLIKVI